MDDDHVITLGVTDTFGVLDVAEVEGVSELEVGDVDLDGLRKVVREAGDFDGVDVLFDHAAGLDSRSFAVEVSGDVGCDFGLAIHCKEIGMEGGPGEWVVLDGLQEGKTGAFAFNVQVHKDVFRGAVGDNIVECEGIDLEVLIFDAASVDDGGQPPFAAHLIEAA